MDDLAPTPLLRQYQEIKKTGLKIEFIDFDKQGDPYAASPRLAIEDVKNARKDLLDVVEHLGETPRPGLDVIQQEGTG